MDILQKEVDQIIIAELGNVLAIARLVIKQQKLVQHAQLHIL